MNTESEIVEKWIGKLADADPPLSSALRAVDPDRSVIQSPTPFARAWRNCGNNSRAT